MVRPGVMLGLSKYKNKHIIILRQAQDDNLRMLWTVCSLIVQFPF